MKKIKFLLLLLFLNLLNYNIFCQNVILNGDFENGNHQSAWDSPINAFQSDYTSDFFDYWRRADGNPGTIYHSPDWRYTDPNLTWLNYGRNYNYDTFYTSPGTTTNVAFGAPSGNGMLGMAPAELIQQGYNLSLLLNSLDGLINPKIRLRFKIRLSNRTNMDASTKLSFYLSKKKLKYKSIDNACANGNKFHEFSTDNYQYMSIYDDNNLLNKYPPGEWHQVEQLVTLPSNIEDYEWIAINLNTFENGNSNCGNNEYCCTNEYLYLDDVELIVGCEDTCSNTDGPMNVQLWGNLITSTNYTRITNLNNVSSLTFSVYALNGDLVYTNSVNCVNGIGHDIYWDGKSIGGANLANAYYKYVIKAKNDCFEKQYTGTIAKNQNYTGPITANFSQLCSNGPNVTPEPCCLTDEYLDYLILTGPINSSYIVKDNIWVCTNTPDFSDEVRILNNADILFQAGKKIELAEGFNTELGAKFIAQIESCDCQGCKIDNHDTNQNHSEIYKKDIKELPMELVDEIKLYPNPTNGVLNIDLNYSSSGNIELYSLDGKLVFAKEYINENKINIDLSNNKSGIYFIRLLFNGETITKKIIKE